MKANFGVIPTVPGRFYAFFPTIKSIIKNGMQASENCIQVFSSNCLLLLRNFTGSSTISMVNMAIQQQGESTGMLYKNKKVFECNKAFSGNMNFKAIRFEVNEKMCTIPAISW